MRGHELRRSYPLTETYLRAWEWGDDTTMLRVSIVATAIAMRSSLLVGLLARWWAKEYR